MSRYDIYLMRIKAGDLAAVDEAAYDEHITHGEYCALYGIALDMAKAIGC